MEKIRLCKEDKIADMPLYAIYLVAGEGYVVANKDDERSKFDDDEVWIRGDNFREFKDNLSMYIEHNMREGYDY